MYFCNVKLFIMNSLYLILSNKKYFSPAWIFASLNIITATWVLYIPFIKEKLAIDDIELGLALFFFATGTLGMIPISSWIIQQIGLGRVTIIALILFALSFLLPFVAVDYLTLCASLFFVGMISCLTDIGMNALVSSIESEDSVHIMSASHGFFSLGGVIGAGVGSFVIHIFEIPVFHMFMAIVFVIATNGILASTYWSIKGREEPKSTTTFNFSLLRPLFGLTVLAFFVMGSEGAIEHWSKLYLQDIVNITSEKVSGFGFIAFSITMTLGRFFGDGISKRFGSISIIIGGCIVSSMGFLAILIASLYTSILGFGLAGLGFSVIIPELFRLAGKTEGVSSARGISFVAGFGYLGFLLSPPFLGFLSGLKDLKLSFIALFIITLIALIIAIFIKKRKA